jgi:hypothetical protein
MEDDMSEKTGTLFGFSLVDLDTFVWGLGPAALGLILIYVAEKVLAPKRALASPQLEPRLARAYSFAWYAALGFFAIFVGVWVAVMFAKSQQMVWALIRSVPPRYTIYAETADELYIKSYLSDQPDFGITYRWVSFDSRRSIYLQVVRKGVNGGADAFLRTDISLDAEQYERATKKSFELEFVDQQSNVPAKLRDTTHRSKEYPLVEQKLTLLHAPRPRQGLTIISTAHAEDPQPFDLGLVKEALLSQSLTTRRAAIAQLAKEVARSDVRDFINAELTSYGSDQNIRLGIATALAQAIRSARVVNAQSYYQVPPTQPIISFLQPNAIQRIVKDSAGFWDDVGKGNPLAAQARTLLLSMYDQRVREAFKNVKGVVEAPTRSCLNLVELDVYYNWLVTLASNFRDGGPQSNGQTPVPKGDLVDAVLLDQLDMLVSWSEGLRSSLVGEHDIANGLLAEYGKGMGYGQIGLLRPERFKAALVADPNKTPQALLNKAKAAFMQFVDESKHMPKFDSEYRYPWHIYVATHFIDSPSRDALKGTGVSNWTPTSGPVSCLLPM